MKFVVAFLLVACLVQGNNAQWGLGTLSSLGSGIWNMAGSAMGTVAGTPAGQHAKKAINCWLGWCDDEEGEAAVEADEERALESNKAATSTAAGAAVIIGNMPGLEFLSAASEGVLGSALSGMEGEELIELTEKLTLNEHLETVLGAQIAVAEQSTSIAERLRALTYGPIAQTGCAPEQVESATNLTTNVAGIPMRAANLVRDGYFAFRECSEHSSKHSRERCEIDRQVPVTVKSAVMVKETNDYTMEAINTIKGMRRAFGKCVRENKNAEAAKAALAAVNSVASNVASDINSVADAASSAVVNAAATGIDAAAATPGFVFDAAAARAESVAKKVDRGLKNLRD